MNSPKEYRRWPISGVAIPGLSIRGRFRQLSHFAKGKPAFGSFDVYVSTRSSPNGRWSAPINLGPSVNTAGSETPSSLSRDLERLYFGRDGDIYSSTHEKLKRAD